MAIRLIVSVAIAGTRQGLHAGAPLVFAAIWRGRDGVDWLSKPVSSDLPGRLNVTIRSAVAALTKLWVGARCGAIAYVKALICR
jgi:hypothetical protein